MLLTDAEAQSLTLSERQVSQEEQRCKSSP